MGELGKLDCESLVGRLEQPVFRFESGVLRGWNDAAAAAVGGELDGTPASELFGDDIGDTTAERTLRTDLHTADGGRVPYEFTLYPSDGGTVAVGRASDAFGGDTTYREVLERMSDGFMALDGWRVTYANPAGARIVGAAAGMDPESVVGTDFEGELPGFADSEFHEQYRGAIETGEPTAFEAYYEPLGAWFDVRAYPSGSELAVYFHDVTEHRRQREALARRERALRGMYEIISDRERPFEEQVRALLDLGRQELGTPYGTLSEIRGEEYTFEVVSADADDDTVREGEVVPTEATNCETVASTERTVVLGDVARDAPGETDRAGYREWGITCYIGAPVYLGSEVYGTFCFYGTESRESFSEWERTLVDLMSRWVSSELGRQRANERLEEFAGVISHDLRNPLNVLQGYLELAEETGEAEHFERCADALERMDDLIEDLLALARDGTAGDDTESVPLGSFAEECWQNVETGGATLSVKTDRSVTGSRTRLGQLFENLFRNAVEHGATNSRGSPGDAVERGSDPDRNAAGAEAEDTPGLSVTVGDLDGGFFVEDDGVGIPADARGAVFEEGYTTGEGTGFGLAIVAEVAEEHGWKVEITTSASGGARFEFRGVG
jgi:signal transduction histidine kinase/PAS domain-containing protein